jgi:hypothetical protein
MNVPPRIAQDGVRQSGAVSMKKKSPADYTGDTFGIAPLLPVLFKPELRGRQALC